MKKPVFRGSAVALITPYTRDGAAVDFDAYGKLIDRQIAGGTAALVVCATTGEAPTLNDDEHHACIDYAVDRAKGRVPVIAGTGSNDTAHAVEMSRYALRSGADAVLMVTPYYNKPTQAGLYKQYAHIAAHVDLPIILYNVPSRTSVCIGAETYEKLSKIENINGVKEASGDFALVNEIFHRCGGDLNVWAGNDDITVPVMAMGGAGVVSTAANVVPEIMAEMCSLYFSGKHAAAAALQTEYYDLMRDLFLETNPIPVKTAVNLIGQPGGALRLPLCEMGEENLVKLKTTLRRHALIG